MDKLKIAYLSASDPRNKKVWSGTHYSIFRTANLYLGEVTPLGPCQPQPATWIGKIITGLSQIFIGKRYNYRHSKLLGRAYARFFQKKLAASQFDLIIAPASLCELSYIETKIPIIYIADNTINLSINYHKSLSKLFKFSENETRSLELKVLKKSSALVVSSEWALNSLKDHYKINPSKLFTIPFGANMETIPDRNKALQIKNHSTCKLLFVGVYWDNKGGDIAYRCLLELLASNFDAELTVVGCTPPEGISHSKMHVFPFIDKNSNEGMKQLDEIFFQHDLLILPTRFDCTPIVICEASAYGMPSLISNTGGVAGHLKEGKNGFLINYNDTGKGYADKIIEIYSNKEYFESLRKSCRDTYEEILNWDNYGKNLQKIAKLILNSGQDT